MRLDKMPSLIELLYPANEPRAERCGAAPPRHADGDSEPSSPCPAPRARTHAGEPGEPPPDSAV